MSDQQDDRPDQFMQLPEGLEDVGVMSPQAREAQELTRKANAETAAFRMQHNLRCDDLERRVNDQEREIEKLRQRLDKLES